MTNPLEELASPLTRALGADFEKVAPAVRVHLGMARPKCRYVGLVRKVWSQGVAGWVATRLLHLPRSANASFVLRNEYLADGMLRHRTTTTRGVRSEASGLMAWYAPRRTRGKLGQPGDLTTPSQLGEPGALVDRVGDKRRFWVELIASVRAGQVHMDSQRLWIRIAGIGIRLPRWLLAQARITEWEEPGQGIGLRLSLVHPFLGDVAGYEVLLRREECGQ